MPCVFFQQLQCILLLHRKPFLVILKKKKKKKIIIKTPDENQHKKKSFLYPCVFIITCMECLDRLSFPCGGQKMQVFSNSFWRAHRYLAMDGLSYICKALVDQGQSPPLQEEKASSVSCQQPQRQRWEWLLVGF